QKGTLSFNTPYRIEASTPLVQIDTALMYMMDKDSVPVPFTAALDSLKNQVDFEFGREANQTYKLRLLPGAISDFFGKTNDTLAYNLTTKSLADYGNLSINIVG